MLLAWRTIIGVMVTLWFLVVVVTDYRDAQQNGWMSTHTSISTEPLAMQGITYDNITIEMLPPSLVSPPNTIRLRFKIADPGWASPSATADKWSIDGLSKLKRENRTTLLTFVITSFKRGTTIGEGLRVVGISLMVADVHGFLEYSSFPIDIGSLLPSPQLVSIPDPSLAAAIRQKIGDSITTHTLLNLTQISVRQ